MNLFCIRACWIPLCINCFVLLVCFAGCGESKKSLHEMDHITPSHWPADLTDAANKMSERLKSAQSGSSEAALIKTTALKELRDLVGWVPEVAADTDLAEQDWMPLYEASESVRKKLLGASDVEANLAQEIEQLCALLVQTQSLIPQPQIPSATDDLTSIEEAVE